MIKYKLSDLKKRFFGSKEIKKVMYRNTQIWPAASESFISPSSFAFSCNGGEKTVTITTATNWYIDEK